MSLKPGCRYRLGIHQYAVRGGMGFCFFPLLRAGTDPALSRVSAHTLLGYRRGFLVG